MMHSPHSDHTAAHKRRPRCALLVLLFLIAGIFLLMYFEGRFIFRYAEAYTRFLFVSWLLITPYVLYRMTAASVFATRLADQYPTRWLRKWVAMLLSASLAVVFVCLAPLGWIFAMAAWSAADVHQTSATAIKVGEYSRRKGCDQVATLRFRSVDKETCLDALYPPSAMRPGQLLDVGIAPSPVGFLIVSIKAAGLDS
ncbi:hypothetical protein [Massilia sp. IC2-476]|uniref:hypothetical protein n=1 Tax=Massilia sp. IC2-476 TaxID=2887199 RepID=UPI001D12FBCC|nr:hypothetical protein [Massilia sp. IC2-476]MCC2972369.1 hypothetical protein [Massilia sp. IC2-476]